MGRVSMVDPHTPPGLPSCPSSGQLQVPPAYPHPRLHIPLIYYLFFFFLEKGELTSGFDTSGNAPYRGGGLLHFTT